MHIAIPDDYQDAVRGLACFADAASRHEITIFNDSVTDIATLAGRFRDADALVLIRERTRIDDELLSRLPALRLISQTGRGTSHIDVDACSRRGVLVCAGTGSPWAPAELTWALVLAASRRVALEAQRLRAGRWQTTLGAGLRGRTLGIWGYGKIGSIVAGYGKAFGMNVIVWGREGSRTRAAKDAVNIAESREALLEGSDVLCLHLRLENETRGIVTAADLGRMKPDSLIVNTSRAELIEPGALERALRKGRPGFAAVDVYEHEPILGAAHPFLQMDNVLCTPHLGYVERDSYELYFAQAFEQVDAFAAGRPIRVVG